MKSLKQRSSTLLNHTIFFKPFLLNQNAILNREQNCIDIKGKHIITNDKRNISLLELNLNNEHIYKMRRKNKYETKHLMNDRK